MDNRKRRTEDKTEASIIRAIARNARKLTGRLPKSLSGVLLACVLVPSVGAMAVVTSSDSGGIETGHAETMFEVERLEAATKPLDDSIAVTAPATTATSTTTTVTSTSTSSATTSTTTTTVTTIASTEPEPIAEPVVVESAPPEDDPETEPIEDAGTTAESEDVGCGITRVTDEELVMLAKTVAQEGGDCSYLQQKCVVWTVLNRMESCEWPNTVAENLTKPRQFAYYSWKTYRSDHYQAVVDAVTEWENGESLLGPDYQYFYGDDWRNHFYGKNSPEYVPD